MCLEPKDNFQLLLSSEIGLAKDTLRQQNLEISEIAGMMKSGKSMKSRIKMIQNHQPFLIKSSFSFSSKIHLVHSCNL